MYIDCHCHIDLLKNLDKVMKEASESGVEIIISNGINPQNNDKVLELASKYGNVKAALGIYPIEALSIPSDTIDEEFDKIRKNKDKIIAIGEVGLDFKESVEKEKQKRVFEDFIKLSKELDKPIIVHSRKAELECIELLESLGAKKVIMHCFSGKMKLVDRVIQNGWTFTIPASIKNSEHFQKVVEKTPIDQLLCETDSPYLHPDKEFPNTPAKVVESYKKIAEIKEISLIEAEEKIENNFKRLFY